MKPAIQAIRTEVIASDVVHESISTLTMATLADSLFFLLSPPGSTPAARLSPKMKPAMWRKPWPSPSPSR